MLSFYLYYLQGPLSEAAELRNWFPEIHTIKVAALKETKMTSQANITTPSYNLVERDRESDAKVGPILHYRYLDYK